MAAPGDDCVLLELAANGRATLGAVTMKALPILFLLAEGGRAAAAVAAQHPLAPQLRGAFISSLAPMSDRPGAVARLEWTSAVGRATKRTLIIDLGRNPSLTLTETPPAVVGTDESPAVSPTVSSWHDDRGRLHARLLSEDLDEPAEESRAFGSLNDAASFMFLELWPEIDRARRCDALERVIERRLRRARRAIDKVRAEVEDAENADRYRHTGQLLLTRQREVRRGQSSVTLTDYDGSTPVVVELDPSISVRENAESYFRRARKAGRRGERAPARLGELEEKAAGLQDAARGLADTSDDELTALEKRFLRTRSRSAPDRKAPKERVRFRTYTVSGGWEVLVGKSNRDNDLLTHRMAKPGDLWFHARQVPGSHVVLRMSGQKAEPDRRAILEAAAIAAFHSKAGKSSKVSVCYTEKRHVRKARGGKPGEAVVAREKVVMVRPKLPES